MSLVQFFMDRDDTRNFVSFLLHKFGAQFALDQSLSPDPPVLDSLAQLDVVIVGDSFTLSTHSWLGRHRLKSLQRSKVEILE